MVTVLHCYWGNSTLCNLQPEGSTHVEQFYQEEEEQGGHVRRGREGVHVIQEPGVLRQGEG